ncbi:MAG: hypothetical protein QXS91_00780 [Candidatus Anstonellales archaeon]
MLAKCKRCNKMHWNLYFCNYCARVICIKCLKASKHINDKAIYKINICKDCWTKAELRKKYKRNEYIHSIE